ncbi:MAG: PCMD domain-containing protein [Bacteroidia bacterium]|nr:PCMD domain-containing protein [Bacteroidia bacterium]
MHKIHTLFIFILCITPSIHAQNPLPDSSFEAWTNAAGYDNLTNWNTLNPSTFTFGVLTALKASGADAHSGTYAVKLVTKTVLSFTANGIATTGNIDAATQTISGGIPYTGRPDSISGWYKYTSVGGDNGFVVFILLDAANDTVGIANFTTPASTVGNYVYFSTAINYYNSSTPTLSRCLLSSSAGFTAVVNSTMYVDDLALISNSTGTRENIPTAINTLKYLPVSKNILIHSPSLAIKRAEVMDMSGKKIISFPVQSSDTEHSLQGLSSGIYFVRLFDESSNINLSQKIIVE